MIPEGDIPSVSTPLHSTAAVGRAVRDARRKRGWTQVDLAEAAGVRQPKISYLERAVGDVSLSTVLRILALLGLELMIREVGSAKATYPWEDA